MQLEPRIANTDVRCRKDRLSRAFTQIYMSQRSLRFEGR